MVAQDSGCNVRDVKRQSQRGRHSEGRRKGKSRDCTLSKALLTRWFKRVRAATLIFCDLSPPVSPRQEMVSQYTFWPVLPRLWEGSHWSLRQTYPAQQVSKARIGADVIPRRVYPEGGYKARICLDRFA
jgi:hypothetical protein